MIEYEIDLSDRCAHRFRVTLQVARAELPLRVSLPVWIPGSYLVREFARHLSGLSAELGGVPCRVEAIDKCSWQVHGSGRGSLRLQYEVHAFDPSVRTAYLDEDRGFFNASSVALWVEGREAGPHRLRIAGLPAGWQAATAMAPAGRARSWQAADYGELIDHPVMLGRFWHGRFELRGVTYEFAVGGAWPGFDGARLLADTRRICDAQIGLWHGSGRPPFDRYVFLLQALDDGYGGLEHRASTALVTARRNLPRSGRRDAGDGYVGLLGLISHEHFHAWNVKRLKPREFEQPDLQAENYTRLLWFFEGFTSYYDDLLLLRAGLIDASRYLRLLAKTVNAVRATPGRLRHSVADASFDAWIKFYRPDENTPNATVSYYAKGSLVALALDLKLRALGRGTLDDVMRALWREHDGGAIGEADIARAVHAVAGRSLQRELRAWVHGTGELPLRPLLAGCGVGWAEEPGDLAAELGLRLSEGPLTGIQIKSVHRGSAAEAAGLAAGDELLAVNGWRVRRLEDARAWLQPGEPLQLLLARDQRMIDKAVAQPPASAPQVALRLADRAPAAARRRRQDWLGA
ncbi:MAG: M61 family metallopeptidase [Proteobacteria bacterium]|nr:M61 family metallopeptidase [Pseudomonadota bacterium]